MSAPRLRLALGASAVVHVAVLGGLLALAHPRFRDAPAMRVALVGRAGPAVKDGSPETAGGTSSGAPTEKRASPAADPSVSGPPRPPPVRASPVTDPSARKSTQPPPTRSSTRVARPPQPRGPGENESGDGASRGAEALVSTVQSDIWVLAGSTPPVKGAASTSTNATGSPEPVAAASGTGSAAGGPEAVGAPSGTAAAAGARGSASGNGGQEPDSPAQSGESLLAALSQRLAWSAARCAPAEVVRTVRHAVPGVPLYFCLDAGGRPSDVRLLGTTGSERLDRAARDCVVPGALPLPPVPGCYTVDVRFPTRG